jgi:hypothetical protein
MHDEMAEEMARITRRCSGLPRGKYLYAISYLGGFTALPQLIVIDAMSKKKTRWRHYPYDGGGFWTDVWSLHANKELVFAFKMHDHVTELTAEICQRACDRLCVVTEARARAEGVWEHLQHVH